MAYRIVKGRTVGSVPGGQRVVGATQPKLTPTPKINQQQGNPRIRQPYIVQPAPGGSYHVYAGGKRVFVKANAGPSPSQAAAPAVTAPAAPPAPDTGYAPDSAYFAQNAQRQFQINQRQADIDAESGNDAASLREALRRLGVQQGQAEENLTNRMQQAGLLYSGARSKDLANLTENYAQQRADQTTPYQERQRARDRARAALEQGYTVDDAADYAAAGERLGSRNEKAAAENNLAPNTPVDTKGQPVVPKPSVPTTRNRSVKGRKVARKKKR